jgi:two-component system sensor histidine kinase KdpD
VVPQRLIAPIRWITAAAALAAIVVIYRRWLHVNPTTVALTLLLLALLLAVRWGLRYAVVVSIAAALCYNFFFLPPLGTWTIAEPQNWIALLAFLTTSVIASRLSIRIQEEALEARRREHEIEVLFQLSRELLQTENVAELLRTVPDSIARVTSASFTALYPADGEQLYLSASTPDEALAGEHPQELMLLPRVTQLNTCAGVAVPLRTGVRPRGVLLLAPTLLSNETLEALGGLVSISIDQREHRAPSPSRAGRCHLAAEGILQSPGERREIFAARVAHHYQSSRRRRSNRCEHHRSRHGHSSIRTSVDL